MPIPSNQNINVALAGDHALNLHALAFLLGQRNSFRVVSISRNISELINSIDLGGQERYPNIVLLDINFDLYRAADILSFLKTTHPEIRLAALGLTRDPKALLRLQELGADGYIPKNSDPSHLENILSRLVSNGNKPVSLLEQASGQTAGKQSAETQPLGKHLPETQSHGKQSLETHPTKNWPSTSPIERRYFRLAMSEASNEDIRRTLKLPESAFTRLVSGLYRQFGVSSRDGLVLALYRHRFIVMDDL